MEEIIIPMIAVFIFLVASLTIVKKGYVRVIIYLSIFGLLCTAGFVFINTVDLWEELNEEGDGLSFDGIRKLVVGVEGSDLSIEEIEKLVYEKTNEYRIGMTPLRLDSELSMIAREHSEDMAVNGFFSHINLKGEDATDRAKNHGIRITTVEGYTTWTGIGENIEKMPFGNVMGFGMVDSEEDVATSTLIDWMNSKGHRDNIMNDRYEVIGVGVAYDNEYFYLTQTFR